MPTPNPPVILSHQLPHKIQLSQRYPCPCCHRGELRSIVLTEAFGCHRCQHIFGLSLDCLSIEQLARTQPHPRLWFWNGKQWVLKQERFPLVVLVSLAVVCLLISITCYLVPQSPLPGFLGWLGVGSTLILIGLAIWILRRP